MFSKRIIPLIIFLVCCAVLVGQHHFAVARHASFEADRTRYMSDVLRITEGVSPVLWIDPQYSYISNAKYFDLSGNGNHGIQDTVDYQPTVTPPGLSFDGTDDYVLLSSSQELSASGSTLSLWFKPNVVSDAGMFVGKTANANTYIRVLTATSIRVQTDIVETYKDFTVPTMSTGTWYFLMVTRSSNTTRVYLNGVESSSGGQTQTDVLTITQIARYRSGESGYFFKGTIDEVRIYNRALSATQIQALYLAGLPKHRQ